MLLEDREVSTEAGDTPLPGQEARGNGCVRYWPVGTCCQHHTSDPAARPAGPTQGSDPRTRGAQPCHSFPLPLEVAKMPVFRIHTGGAPLLGDAERLGALQHGAHSAHFL